MVARELSSDSDSADLTRFVIGEDQVTVILPE